MSDTYQPIYDAVRSRLQGSGDIGSAIEAAIRDANVGHYVEQAYREIQNAGFEMQRPSAVYRPALKIDGDQWCALYGDNLQDGVCGFGSSPSIAMRAFDVAWFLKLQQKGGAQ